MDGKALWGTLIGLLAMGAATRADEADVARFREEYPSALERLEARFAQYRANATMMSEDGKGSGVVSRLEIAADHGFQKVRSLSKPSPNDPPGEIEGVICVGERSAFSISRVPEYYEAFQPDGSGDEQVTRAVFNQEYGAFINAPFAMFGRPLSEALKMPGVRLVSVEKLDDEPGLLRVVHEMDAYFQGVAVKSRLSMTLDPDAAWVIRSIEHQFESMPGLGGNLESMPGLRGNLEVEYGETRDGIPLPRTVKGRNYVGEKKL